MNNAPQKLNFIYAKYKQDQRSKTLRFGQWFIIWIKESFGSVIEDSDLFYTKNVDHARYVISGKYFKYINSWE